MTGPTFPFVEDTLGKKRQIGSKLSAVCLTCRNNRMHDLDMLIGRLGEDFGCMHWDLIKVIYCGACRDAGRPVRNLSFTNHAETPEARRAREG